MIGFSMLVNAVLLVASMGILNTSVAVAKSGTYGPIVSQRTWIRAEKRPVEEALLNFKIEAAVDGMLPAGCHTDLTLGRDRRLLDPQLPASDKRKNLDPPTFIVCAETEPVLPMNQ